jgi:hypothetical protein
MHFHALQALLQWRTFAVQRVEARVVRQRVLDHWRGNSIYHIMQTWKRHTRVLRFSSALLRLRYV